LIRSFFRKEVIFHVIKLSEIEFNINTLAVAVSFKTGYLEPDFVSIN
jgi:hypothetical protein